MTEREILKKLKKLKEKNIHVEKQTEEELKFIHDRKKRWCTYWRFNINLYISEKLGINTYPYQHMSYYEMGESTTYFEISTRNTAKSMRAAVYANALAMIKPYSEIVVTAVTLGQAKVILEAKLIGEIFKKESMSKVMPFLFKEGLVKLKETDKGVLVTYWNGSTILFAPCLDTVRGERATCIILEECRLMKKGLIDSVFKPMLRPRNAGYKSLPEYAKRRDLDEDPQTIYLSSNRFRGDWFNKEFNKTFLGYFKNKRAKDRVFCVDIYVALKHGLKSINWFLSEKDKMSPLDWDAEILNLDIGEADNAFFSRELFEKNQVIKKAFYPYTFEQIKTSSYNGRKKKNNEYRFVFADLSWVGDNEQNKNDNTVIGLGSVFFEKEKLYRQADYFEVRSGKDIGTLPIRLRELFFDFEADYLVYDARSNGESMYVSLSTPMQHPYRGEEKWFNNGLGLCNERDLLPNNDSKIEEYRYKTIDPDAIPCLIPLTATGAINNDMWTDLNTRLRSGELKFLIDDLSFNTWFQEQKDWFSLTSEERANMLNPYIQTNLTIQEAIQLTGERKSTGLSLDCARNQKKDRITALAYFNYIASKLETKLLKNMNKEIEDISEWQLVW